MHGYGDDASIHKDWAWQQQSCCRAAGRGEALVSMNAKRFWRELGGALGMHLGVFTAC